jgi:transcription initiation factor TFIIIB Brf1 subunit/transcription initiation factor TFIIB
MVLESIDENHFEQTSSLEPTVNYPKCKKCDSKAAFITDLYSGERVCQYCGEVVSGETDMQSRLELLAVRSKISHNVRTSMREQV